jgi:cold-shock DNA-binding protein family
VCVSDFSATERLNPEVSVRHEGEVTWFNDKKGFGFITGDDGVDVFVHYTEIVRDGFQSLDAGERVSYGVTDEEVGPKAVDVHPIAEKTGESLL